MFLVYIQEIIAKYPMSLSFTLLISLKTFEV